MGLLSSPGVSGASSDRCVCEIAIVLATSSSVMSIPFAISACVASRPSSWSSALARLPMRCSVPARLRGADQPEVALVDEIRERHALVLIFLRHRNDEPQVRADELVERFLLTLANVARKARLFIARYQRIRADVAEVLIE